MVAVSSLARLLSTRSWREDGRMWGSRRENEAVKRPPLSGKPARFWMHPTAVGIFLMPGGRWSWARKQLGVSQELGHRTWTWGGGPGATVSQSHPSEVFSKKASPCPSSSQASLLAHMQRALPKLPFQENTSTFWKGFWENTVHSSVFQTCFVADESFCQWTDRFTS